MWTLMHMLYQVRTSVSAWIFLSLGDLEPTILLDSSEYLAECDERRAFISGFNGSAGMFLDIMNHLVYWHIWPGCAVITLTEAFLFTDGRYFLQAEKQLDSYGLFYDWGLFKPERFWCSNWTLMKQGLPGAFLLGHIYLRHFMTFVRCTDMARILVQSRIAFSKRHITPCWKFHR